jgi:hypothetical protein
MARYALRHLWRNRRGLGRLRHAVRRRQHGPVDGRLLSRQRGRLEQLLQLGDYRVELGELGEAALALRFEQREALGDAGFEV